MANKPKSNNLFRAFFTSEKTGGLLLIACTIISVTLANSPLANSYTQLYQLTVVNHFTITHLINDGLMSIFFLLIGLELEREVYIGELATIKKATLPFAASIGGMVIPACIYLLATKGTYSNGAGIPVATDIAFALGILSLVGNRVPSALKVFLTALAVIDDLGAIIIIGIFYTSTISWIYLGFAALLFFILLLLNRLKVHVLYPYLIGGVAMWFCMLYSGIHPTITGVLVAFVIPFQRGGKGTISHSLQAILHKPVAFIVLPLFALANTAISLQGGVAGLLSHTYTWGVGLGLLIGKPVGITISCLIAVYFGWCKLPSGIAWRHIVATSILGGIGFTMSIFITLLAFNNTLIINHVKLTILFTSLLAGAIGYMALRYSVRSK